MRPYIDAVLAGLASFLAVAAIATVGAGTSFGQEHQPSELNEVYAAAYCETAEATMQVARIAANEGIEAFGSAVLYDESLDCYVTESYFPLYLPSYPIFHVKVMLEETGEIIHFTEGFTAMGKIIYVWTLQSPGEPDPFEKYQEDSDRRQRQLDMRHSAVFETSEAAIWSGHCKTLEDAQRLSIAVKEGGVELFQAVMAEGIIGCQWEPLINAVSYAGTAEIALSVEDPAGTTLYFFEIEHPELGAVYIWVTNIDVKFAPAI